MEPLYYVKHKSINKQLWDQSVRNAVNGSFFGYSWYLDIVNDDWNALINKDYSLIMPLPILEKRGTALSLPPFSGRLGIFMKDLKPDRELELFYSEISKLYQYIYLPLNKYNGLSLAKNLFIEHSLYELDLILSYNRLYHNFSDETKERIEQGLASNIKVVQGLRLKDFMDMYVVQLLRTKRKHNNFFLNTIQRIILRLTQKRIGEVYGAYSDKNMLCAIGFFVWSHEKIHLLFYGLSNEGIDNQAHYVLLNQFLKNYSQRNATLVFEEDPNPASKGSFYKGFGAMQCHYKTLALDRRPWLQRLMSGI